MSRLPHVSPLPSMCAGMALALPLIAGWFGLWAKIAPPGQVAYLGTYLGSGLRAGASHTFHRPEKPATYPVWVMRCGHAECLATDPAQGVRVVVPAVPSKLHATLARQVYRNRSLNRVLEAPLEASAATVLALVLVALYRHQKVWRELRSENGRLVTGRKVLTEREINRLVRGDGVAIWTER